MTLVKFIRFVTAGLIVAVFAIGLLPSHGSWGELLKASVELNLRAGKCRHRTNRGFTLTKLTVTIR